MRRDVVELWSPELGWAPRVIAYGSYGRPVLVFPSSEGRAEDFEGNGMVEAVRPLIDAGRVKLYCLDSWDGGSWYRSDLPLEERARRHEAYERWVVEGAVPYVDADCGGRQEMAVAGCSLGAYHAANLALRRADLFPLALCFPPSGSSARTRGCAWRSTSGGTTYRTTGRPGAPSSPTTCRASSRERSPHG